jgi:release factor glutamine methyltransferase
VPRPETELLVEWVSALLAELPMTRAGAPASVPPRVVDLGTGSGAIALALKTANPLAAVTATDVSAASLALARRNAARLGRAIEAIETSWWDGLAHRRFDIAVANPPYIAADDPHLEALRHEPLAALTPGNDGLAALKAIVAGAPRHLEPGGWLVLEHGFDQAGPVRGLLAQAGFVAVETRCDLAGLERATGGRLGAV